MVPLPLVLAVALPWAPDHILVTLAEDAGPEVGASLAGAGAADMEPLLPAGSPLAEAGGLGRTFVVTLGEGVDPVRAAAALESVAGVERAGIDPAGRGADLVPDDPEFSREWGFSNVDDTDVDAPAAWDLTTGGSILIAVVDTGVDPSLPDLAGAVVPGRDFVNGDDDPSDDHGHGTAIASVIAARGNDGSGMAGLCWECRILAIKVLDSDNLGFYSHWIQGIEQAVAAGARVINLSLGGDTPSGDLEAAVTAARDAGVVVVAAMMNDGDDTPYYPAAYEAAIAVGATDDRGRRAIVTGIGEWASSFGDHIDLCAPGVDILAVSLAGGTLPWSGTSLAAPFVSGGSALALTIAPDADPGQIEFALEVTARDGEGRPDEDTPGWDPYHGAGRLDLDLLLAVAAEGFVDGDGDGTPAGMDCDDSDPALALDCAAPAGGSCGCALVR